MASKYSAGVVSDVTTELVSLSVILKKNRVCAVDSLNDAVRSLWHDDQRWSYDLGPLVFKPPVEPIKAVTGDLAELKIELTASVGASTNASDDHDPLEHLACNIRLHGVLAEAPKKLFFCWHIDRDADYESGTSTGSDPHVFVHPRYHVQHGGSSLKKYLAENHGNDGYGSALILDSPRFAHPPLDAILGIDFVLTNFYPFESREFCREESYRRLVASAQERYWKPYVLALSKAWSDMDKNTAWSYRNVWPQLS